MPLASFYSRAPRKLQRGVDQDGGEAPVAGAILWQSRVLVRSGGIWDLKDSAAGRTKDLNAHVLRDSISDRSVSVAGRTRPSNGAPLGLDIRTVRARPFLVA